MSEYVGREHIDGILEEAGMREQALIAAGEKHMADSRAMILLCREIKLLRSQLATIRSVGQERYEAGRQEGRAGVLRHLANEADCRVEHGGDLKGFSDYLQAQLLKARSSSPEVTPKPEGTRPMWDSWEPSAMFRTRVSVTRPDGHRVSQEWLVNKAQLERGFSKPALALFDETYPILKNTIHLAIHGPVPACAVPPKEAK